MKRFFYLLLLAATGFSHAAEVGFIWSPVTYHKPIIYEVHYGTASRVYNGHVDALGTEATITAVPAGVKQFYAVRACVEDRSVCSGFSNEVAYTVPEPPPGIPQGFTIKIEITVEPE